MVFSRLFGGKNEPQDEDPGDEGAEDEAPEGDVDDESPEELPDTPWKERAAAVIVGSTSTGSKREKNLWGTTDAHAPTHYVQANGCRIVTTDDETLIDCTMALGSVAIGYADERITSAVVAAAASGHVSGLPHVLEIDVAERFCELVPCAERVQFMKSGAEAVAAAVRIARAYTGRSRVVGCGYFGWSDWCSDEAGVPAGVKSDFARIPFGDIAALEAAVGAAGKELAAIVLEPVIEAMPSTEWIQRARDLATSSGAALIFDEIKTGFRLAPGGYQEVSGITPDLSAFGKAFANGYPLSAVCGLAPLMQAAAEKTWISSTLAGETTALAAARAVMLIHDQDKVGEKLAKIGGDMRVAVSNALRAGKLDGISIAGIDPMWFLKFDSAELETRFLTAAASQGVLFKRGPYNFAALAHDEATIHEVESATSNAIVAMRDELA
jgi:glutamate-1-semialdehyde 2,1-aminomutase